jgi:hypothetical protein
VWPVADHKLDELARIEFTGSLAEAFGRYAWALREISQRWDAELGMAASDVRAALMAIRGQVQTRWDRMDSEQILKAPNKATFAMLYSPAERRIKAWRVARRLRRAQTLVAAVTKCAERLPREYAKQFLQGHHKDGKGGGSA